jgi:hypothetical protein
VSDNLQNRADDPCADGWHTCLDESDALVYFMFVRRPWFHLYQYAVGSQRQADRLKCGSVPWLCTTCLKFVTRSVDAMRPTEP